MTSITKQYTYIFSETAIESKFDKDDPYNKGNLVLKDNEQCPRVFFNVNEAIDDFLKTNDYQPKTDSKLFFNKTIDQASGEEIATLCFNKILLPNKRRPTAADIYKYEHENAVYYKCTCSMMIYEFKCKPLTLRMIKMNADLKKYD